MFVAKGYARKFTIQSSSLNVLFGVPRGKKDIERLTGGDCKRL
jgi:hypothetical protein